MNTQSSTRQPPGKQPLSKRDALWANLVSPFGYVLAFSYPVLALSISFSSKQM
jgi:hypothetical protein